MRPQSGGLVQRFPSGPTAEVSKPDNKRLVGRLRQLGYSVPDEVRLLPTFDRSYLPFRTYPLRKRRGVRWMAWRKLMVSAVNAGIQQRLFGLSPGEDWWPSSATTPNDREAGHFGFLFANGTPAIASVSAISGGELAVHVLLDPRRPDLTADRSGGLEDGSASAHGGDAFSCRRALLPVVAGSTVEPLGYSDQGIFIM